MIGNRKEKIDSVESKIPLELDRAWKNDSAVKSALSEDLGSNPSTPGLQQPVIPVPKDPFFSGFLGHQEHTWCTDIHVDKMPINIRNKKTSLVPRFIILLSIPYPREET